MVDARRMVKSLAGFSVVPITTALITVFVIPVVSHVFPAEEYGKINMFYSVGTLFSIICMLGLDNSFIRYYFEPPPGLSKGNMQSLVAVVGVCATAIFTLIMIIFAPSQVSRYLFGEDNPQYVLLLGVYVSALVLFRVLNIDARFQEKHIRYNIQSISQIFVTRIAFVGVAFYSTYYAYSIIAMTAGMAILSLLFLVLQRRSFLGVRSNIPSRSLKILFSFGVPVMMSNFILNLNGMVGKLVMSAAGMYEEVGVFAIATTLSNVFVVIPTAFSTFWSPFMYKNYKTEQQTIIKIHDLIMMASGIIVGLIIASQSILFAIVGEGYADCQAYFMIIMLNPIQALICETTSYGIVLKNNSILNMYASVSGIVASIVVTLVFLDSLGVYAAALGVAISALVAGVFRSIAGQRFYKTVDSPKRSVISCSIIFFACSLNSFIVSSVCTQVVVGSLVVAVFAFLYRRQAANAFVAFKRRDADER